MSRRPLHPLLFAALPALSLFQTHFAEVTWASFAIALAIVEGVALGVWGLVRLALLREAHRAALFVSPLILFASFCVSDGPRWWTVFRSGFELQLLAPLFVLPAVGLVLLAAFLGRARRDLRPVTAALNFGGVATVGILCARLLAAQLSAQASAPIATLAPDPRPPEPAPHGDAPNVYVIISDAHARPDLLQSLYGADTAPFLAGLQRHGFHVVEGSRSNYDCTSLSVPATLAMDYLRVAQVNVHRLAEVPAAARFLKDRGYTFVALENLHYAGLSSADVVLRPAETRNDFHRQLFSAFFSEATFDQHERRRALFVFDELERLAGTRRPQFVVAHLMSPHDPYVFDRKGNEVATQPNRPRREAVLAYAEQAEFIDARLLKTIEVILAKEAVSPVIVLVSDHGPWLYYQRDAPHSSFLLDHFANLIAVRLPGGERDCLWDGMSLVNVLRSVFHCQFGADLPRLPDRQLAKEGDDLVDVTDEIGSAADWKRHERLLGMEGFPE
ncbi:MAG: sulfatase-like hydrolase/transferase [Myxococcales bacterium]